MFQLDNIIFVIWNVECSDKNYLFPIGILSPSWTIDMINFLVDFSEKELKLQKFFESPL